MIKRFSRAGLAFGIIAASIVFVYMLGKGVSHPPKYLPLGLMAASVLGGVWLAFLGLGFVSRMFLLLVRGAPASDPRVVVILNSRLAQTPARRLPGKPPADWRAFVDKVTAEA